MPSCVRKEKEKKIALINSAKNCHKLTQLFKLISSTTINKNSVVSSFFLMFLSSLFIKFYPALKIFSIRHCSQGC